MIDLFNHLLNKIRMTVIDPKKRPTATQMLQEPIFKKFQNN